MLLTLSVMIIVGFFVAEFSNLIKIPRVVWLLLGGMILGPFGLNLIAPEVQAISTDLRQIALIIILLRAGLSLDVRDLKQVGRPAILLSFVPALLEIIGALILAPLLLGFTLLEAAILGSIIAAVSPAVIVPRMLQMLQDHHGTKQSIPQMIMAAASIDDVLVIVIFTSLIALAQGDASSVASLFVIPVSLLTGVVVGVVLGLWLVYLFQTHHTRDTNKVLLMLAISFLMVTVEQANVIPYSGLLSAMTLGITVLIRYPVLADRLVIKYEKIWVFAEVLLFVLVGAVVDLSSLSDVSLIAIALVIGMLVFRLIGVGFSTTNTSLTYKERLFVGISFLPKATVQASIGAIPLALGLSQGNTILTISVIAILLTAPLGAFFMDQTKHRLIRR